MCEKKDLETILKKLNESSDKAGDLMETIRTKTGSLKLSTLQQPEPAQAAN